MKMPKVTWIRPETERSNPGQGEAFVRKWRPEVVLWACVHVTWD